MGAALQITKLPPGVTCDQCRALAETIGPVEDALQIKIKKVPAVLILMADESSAAEAVQRLNGQTVELADGQTAQLTVSEATPEQLERLNKPVRQLARELARILNEKEEKPLFQLEKLIQLTSPEFAQELLQETFAIEEQGGMMLKDGSRRRTIGGVFFQVIQKRAAPKVRREIFFKTPFRLALANTADQAAPDMIRWDARMDVLNVLLQEKGEATTVKVTLIGRPGRIEERRDMVIMTMSYVLKGNLPKGLPTPPNTPTPYAVYIAAKQWRRVADAIRNPQDALIIEGHGVYDPEIKGMAIFATNVTTKLLQQAKRQEQKSAALQGKTQEGEAEPESGQAPALPERKPEAGSVPKQPASSKPQPKPAAPPPPATPTPKGPPSPEMLRKLAELHDAEQEARRELDEIKALPPDEQTGLTQALQRLQKIKAEIKTLQGS